MEQSLWSLNSNGTFEATETELNATPEPFSIPTHEVADLLVKTIDICLDQQMREMLVLLAEFSTMFKKRRIELGIPQRLIGQAMEQFPGIGGTRSENRGISQSYVSCFEELRLPPLSMIKLLPLFQRTLQAMLTNECQKIFPESFHQKPSEIDLSELHLWENRAEKLFLKASGRWLPETAVQSWISAVRSPPTPQEDQKPVNHLAVVQARQEDTEDGLSQCGGASAPAGYIAKWNVRHSRSASVHRFVETSFASVWTVL
uniref:POU-specific domain-containing protein n=1 Tax=Steinernema glaseri TaxID=37863 RepID=A0A1I7Y466_9BILA